MSTLAEYICYVNILPYYNRLHYIEEVYSQLQVKRQKNQEKEVGCATLFCKNWYVHLTRITLLVCCVYLLSSLIYLLSFNTYLLSDVIRTDAIQKSINYKQFFEYSVKGSTLVLRKEFIFNCFSSSLFTYAILHMGSYLYSYTDCYNKSLNSFLAFLLTLD